MASINIKGMKNKVEKIVRKREKRKKFFESLKEKMMNAWMQFAPKKEKKKRKTKHGLFTLFDSRPVGNLDFWNFRNNRKYTP